MYVYAVPFLVLQTLMNVRINHVTVVLLATTQMALTAAFVTVGSMVMDLIAVSCV